MISIAEAKRLAKRTLSEKRYTHTRNVQKLAVELAKRHGADADKAALAALLHDIMKEAPRERQLQLCEENDIIAGNVAQRPFPVWHGVAAAVYAKQFCGVEDEEILSAIACHTTGRAGMSLLDKIIYLADVASEERAYPEAQELRREAMTDLDKALVAGLGMSIAWLKKDGRPVDDATLDAYAYERKMYYGGK